MRLPRCSRDALPVSSCDEAPPTHRAPSPRPRPEIHHPHRLQLPCRHPVQHRQLRGLALDLHREPLQPPLHPLAVLSHCSFCAASAVAEERELRALRAPADGRALRLQDAPQRVGLGLPRRVSFCSASWATASASRSTWGHSAAKSPAALFASRSCTFASMPSSVGAAARSCSRRSRALRSASSAKGRRWLPPPDSFQGAATLTSWSWRRVAPAPKSESRPKAMTRAMPSWGLRTTVTRERSCDDHPCARKRPSMRCTKGCDRWRCATPELMRSGGSKHTGTQRPLAPLPRGPRPCRAAGAACRACPASSRDIAGSVHTARPGSAFTGAQGREVRARARELAADVDRVAQQRGLELHHLARLVEEPPRLRRSRA
jgi:hypothetical protein